MEDLDDKGMPRVPNAPVNMATADKNQLMIRIRHRDPRGVAVKDHNAIIMRAGGWGVSFDQSSHCMLCILGYLGCTIAPGMGETGSFLRRGRMTLRRLLCTPCDANTPRRYARHTENMDTKLTWLNKLRKAAEPRQRTVQGAAAGGKDAAAAAAAGGKDAAAAGTGGGAAAGGAQGAAPAG